MTNSDTCTCDACGPSCGCDQTKRAEDQCCCGDSCSCDDCDCGPSCGCPTG